MRILFLTPLFPYPPTSGGLIKSWTLLQFLSKQHGVDVLCFRRSDLSPEQESFAAGHEGRIASLPLDRRRSLGNLLRSYGAGLPLSIYRNYSREMAALVRARLEGESYDAVFIDHWLMAQYLPLDFRGLSLLHQHNAEHLIWQRQAALERSPWRKLLLTLEARRLRRHEASVLPRLSWLFAVSEAERRAIVDLGAPSERVLILPNLPDPRLLERPPLKFEELPPHVLYVGTLSWQPNSQGLRSFLDEAYPLLRREVPEARLIIAGAEPPPWLWRLVRGRAGLELITPVEDAEVLYRRSRVFLEPVRGGGGTKVKVLNALARGLPVVATPDGVDGIEARADEQLLVAADAPSLVAAVRRLLADERLWQRLSESGRALIRERYRPEVAYLPLERALSGSA